MIILHRSLWTLERDARKARGCQSLSLSLSLSLVDFNVTIRDSELDTSTSHRVIARKEKILRPIYGGNSQ